MTSLTSVTSLTTSLTTSLPWVEKYRPKTVADVKGHAEILTVLKKFKGISRTPNLLFYGPPGTGKTSTILAMAKEHYGPNMRDMVMEINASDERGIEVVTGRVKSFVQTHSFSGLSVKLVILDEADALTAEAQSALRRIMERSTSSARFCLCCNYIGKIIPPLQSRCTKFRFEGIDKQSLHGMALSVCHEEDLVFEEGAIDAVLRLANGDARRVMNLLQSASMGCLKSDPCSVEYIYRLAGSPLPSDLDHVFSVLLSLSFKDSFHSISVLVNDKGYAVTEIVTDLSLKVLSRFAEDTIRLSILLDEFSNIEYNLAVGGSEKLAVGHLVSAFHMF